MIKTLYLMTKAPFQS